jgi:hypothetical protein
VAVPASRLYLTPRCIGGAHSGSRQKQTIVPGKDSLWIILKG